jgi:hypothetical protein
MAGKSGMKTPMAVNVSDWQDVDLEMGIWLRIRAMQFLANVSLFIMVLLNWDLNPDAFEVQSRSTFLHDLNIFLIGALGIGLGVLVCVLPMIIRVIETNWENFFPMEYTRKRGIAFLVLILFLLGLIAGLENTILFTLEVFLTIFFCAALIFGMYGIWHQRGPHLVTAAMFSFATAIGRLNFGEQIPEILAFAIFFLCFIELSESSARYNALMTERMVPVKHQAKMLEKYFEHLLIFMLLAFGLTYFSLYGRQMADAFSGTASAEALELHTLYGIVPPAVFIIVGLIILRALWNAGQIHRWYRSLHKVVGILVGEPTPAGGEPVAAGAASSRRGKRSRARKRKKR